MHLRSLTSTVLAAVSTMAIGLLLWSAPASALNRHTFSHSFGTAGSEAGQLETPKGIAVNDASHDLYVVDSGNDRVERFTSAGVYIGQFDASGTYEVEGKVEHGAAAPTGAFSNPTRIAVDDSGNPLDPSNEDVYVIDRGHNVVDKFSAEGAYLGQITTSRKLPFERLAGVAVDTTGGLWVTQEVHETEGGYDGSGELINYSDGLVNEFLSSSPTTIHTGSVEGGLAVNSEDRLYVPARGVHQTVAEEIQLIKNYKIEGRLNTNLMTDVAVDTSDNEAYVGFAGRVEAYEDSHNNPLQQVFGEGDLSSGDGVAVDSSTHTVYVADGAADAVAVFGRVIVPDVVTGTAPAEEEQEGSVTLEGTVNPDGEPVTSCQFEYGEPEVYGLSAECEALPGSGSNPVTVRARVSGLVALTTYHYRLVAGNANGTNAGSDESFTAPVRPSVGTESAEAIVSDAATLRAEIDPGGADTAYRFEYGSTSAYGASVPVTAGDAGAGVEDTSVYARAQGLSPGTTYHFRVVISSAADREVVGPDEQFTTQPAGGVFQLPDGREWEMVSPPDKHGAGLYAVGYYEGADIQAALGGEAFAWAASAPIESNPAGGRVGETTQVFTKRRAPGVWESLDIATPHTEGASIISGGHISEYRLFSEDLSLALVEPAGHTPLPPLPEGSEKTFYIRDNASGSYRALVTSANVPAGTRFGGDGEIVGGAVFSTATPDLSHVVIRSSVALTEGSKAEGGLYEWTDGKLQLVDVLPNGTQASLGLGAAMGEKETSVRHAISDDGSRLVWEAEGSLYLRDMAAGTKGETVQVDAPQGGSEPKAGLSVYQTASSDDSRVFFTSAAPLTANSTAAKGAQDLYVFELTSAAGEPLAGTLTDLTVDANPGESAAVQRGVIGASEDGSYVYFVANGVLGDGAQRGAKQGSCIEAVEAPSRMCNLYVEHRDAATHTWGAPVFIAALSSEDLPDWGASQGGADLTNMTSRVSPNGRYLAFMSDRSLTGYANRDASSGVPDEEVFLYDAQSERLVCASCDPTGAQPTGVLGRGVFHETLVDNTPNWGGHWLAANVPGWTSQWNFAAEYQSRYLSDGGRLYFNSSDSLVPADVNGQEDVYEYEPAGVGSCQPPGYGQSASVVFSAAAGGCVGLLSSGLSAEESAFMDASETGGDVFFMTASRLSPLDYDTSFDVYDAHECTAAAPCAAPAALVPPSCTTGDACKPAPTPQPASFGAPSSETFSGAGNIAPSGSPPAVTPRSSVQAQKLARALKKCRKKAKRRRAKCAAQARRRYGAKSSRAHGGATANSAYSASRGVAR